MMSSFPISRVRTASHCPWSLTQPSLEALASRAAISHQLHMVRERSQWKSNMSTMDDSRRIHVLGTGNIGRLYAHALATAPSPAPITLLFHRASLLIEWEEAGRTLEIEGIERFLPGIPTSSSGYDVEVLPSSILSNKTSSNFEKSRIDTYVGEPSKIPKTPSKIKNLMVATKAPNTVEAIGLIKDRLDNNSTILFTQNGLGTVEEIMAKYFNDSEILSEEAPSFLAAITSHGIYSTGPFRSVLAGFANVTIGFASVHKPERIQAQYLLEKIATAPLLNATAVYPKELEILRLRKLVINAMINPLTVIFQRKNGNLFNHKPICELMRVLLSEVREYLWRATKDRHSDSSINSLNLQNELHNYLRLDLTSDEFEQHFSLKGLEQLVLSIANKTAQNTSSMLQDVQAGRATEIDYINGWCIRDLNGMETRQGNDVPPALGFMSCNYVLVNMVKEGQTITEDEICERFGLEWNDTEDGSRLVKRQIESI